MAFTVEVDFGSGYENITAHCANLEKTQILHNKMHPTINTCRFDVSDKTTANKFNDASADMPLRVKNTAVDWFIGLIRPTFKNQIAADLEAFSVEGYDKGILLQKTIDQNITWKRYKISDPANKSSSILHQLFYEAGLIDAELSFLTINKTLTCYAVSASDEKTYKAEIQDLLFEFGYVYDVKDGGIFELQDLYPDPLPGGTAINDSKIHHGMKISKKEIKYEAVKVAYHSTFWLRDQFLYAESRGANARHACEIKLWPKQTWPGSVGNTFNYKIDSYDTIYHTANHRLVYEVTKGIYPVTQTFRERDATIQFYNPCTFSKKIIRFDIKGDALVREENTYDYSTHFIVVGTEKIQKISTRFIENKTDADKLASGLAKYYDYADFLYSFETEEAIDVGDYLDLTEAVMGITTDLRVVEVKEDELGYRCLRCEGVSAYVLGAITEEHTITYPPMIEIVEDQLTAHRDRMDALAGLEEEGVHEFDDPVSSAEELFEFSSPDCVSNEARVPTDKIIHYEPAEYADERGILYRNPHTKMWNGLSEAIFQEGKNLIKSPEALIPPDWIESNAKATLTGQYVNGLQLTKVLATAANGQVYRSVVFTGDGVKTVQVIVEKGNDTDSRILLYETTTPANRLYLIITWATQTITETTGTLHGANWIDDETVEILAITTSITAANTNQLRLRTATNGKYTYFTAAQAEDLSYPTPYIPQYRYPTRVRPKVSPDYRVDMQSKMVFKVKVKPWFVYDTGGYHRIAEWYIDTTHRLITYWHAGNDKLVTYWIDGGTGRMLESQQFDDGTSYDDINSELIICGAIRLDQQTGQRFFVIADGAKQTEDTSFSGAPDAKASPFPTLSIGHENEASHADSCIESVQIWDWDGTDLGTIDNESDFDAAVASLTERFSHTLEDYDSKYQPLSKRGTIGAFQAIDNECAGDAEDLTGTNWTTLASNCTPSLSDFYIGGHRFTKLLNSAAAAGYVAYAIAASTFTATPCSLLLIAKYGNAAVSKAELYDNGAPASRIVFTITWATFTVAASTGTLFESHWISPDTVEILLISAAITVGNVHHLRVYASNAATLNEYTYWTCAFPHDSIYPLSYTPIAREKSILNYTLRMPPVFTVMFWIRPWFAYTTAVEHRFIEWYVDATHRFYVFYDQANNKIAIGWINGGTVRYLESQLFDDGSAQDDINKPIYVAAKIDLTAGQTGSALWINGISRDGDWAVAPDAYTDDFPTLSIGHENELLQADSMFADLLFYPGLVDDSVIKDHYLKNRPWYEPSEIANAKRTVRIDRAGIRLHNSSLTITDQYNRLIDISNQAGMKAQDAAGTPIHDIPDALIQAGRFYCGHLIWFTDLTTYQIYNSVDPPLTTWTNRTCVLEGNTNVKAGLFKVVPHAKGTATTSPISYVLLRPKGSTWGVNYSSNTPMSGILITTQNAEVKAIKTIGLLICPIGDDNSIQFYFQAAPSDGLDSLVITQLGVFI